MSLSVKWTGVMSINSHQIIQGKNLKWNQILFNVFHEEKNERRDNFNFDKIKFLDSETDEMLCSWFDRARKSFFCVLFVAENLRRKTSINRIMVLSFGLFQFCEFFFWGFFFLRNEILSGFWKTAKKKLKNVSTFQLQNWQIYHHSYFAYVFSAIY